MWVQGGVDLFYRYVTNLDKSLYRVVADCKGPRSGGPVAALSRCAIVQI